MIRRIIEINEEKCNGCGICANACHEGAIGIVDGKAKLLRDDYCDGLGDCLPACPQGAITFIEREAAAYDEVAVKQNQKQKNRSGKDRENGLVQWPVQIKLVPCEAPYYHRADLLIAADCTAYAYAGFHGRFLSGCVTLIACPKLDMIDYSVKLADIFMNNDLKSITVVRMEVPCCGGIEAAVKNALQASGKTIPFRVFTISTDGRCLDD